MSVAASRLRVPRAVPGRADEDRARLAIVGPRSRRRARHRIAPLLSAGVVSGSLFAVVVGHAVLAQEQVKLAAVDAALTSAQVQHRHEVVSLGNLENPTRILHEAESALSMGTPGKVVQVPHVTLGVALAAPKVAQGASAGVSSTGSSATSATAPPPTGQ